MNFFRLLLGDNTTQDGTGSLSSLLSAHLESPEPLPENYYLLFMGQHENRDSKMLKFEAIVKNMQKVATPQAVIKNLALVLKTLSMNQYQDGFLQKLQEMENPQFDHKPELNLPWLRQLYVGCKSYLMRLASVSELLQRSSKYNELGQEILTFKVMLSDLYLTLNTVGLLFPYATNAINTIGRYYLKTNKYFNQFYQLLRDSLNRSYKYMKFIVDSFLVNHSKCEVNELQCFMQTLPEIQLMCDKIEEFLMNKYFKGYAPAEKLYLKEEDIEEVSYYLKQKQTVFKDGDSTESAQEEQFGQYIES